MTEVENYLDFAIKSATKWFSEPRSGKHVSDVIMCPRQRTFETLDSEGPPMTEKKLGYFTAGKAVHSIIQALFMSNKMRFEKEKYVEYQGVEGHVDLWDKHKNVPLEIKTYYGDFEPSKPNSYNEEQLKYYMAMLDAPVGVIIYQFLSKKIDKNWKQFPIIMDEEERKLRLKLLTAETNSLHQAIDNKDPSRARGVWDSDIKWLCTDCKYLKECEGMRPAK